MGRERAPYDREHITDTYNAQDPVEFLRSNWGELQDDGSWIMKRSLILRKRSPIVKNGKFIVKIKRVEGHFNCGGQGLTTLEGGPEYVKENYWCGDNKLTSLKHSPTFVGGDYSIQNNKLENLDYIPKEINGEFDIGYNHISTLEGGPTKIKGDLVITSNKLTDLVGCPEGAEQIHIFHATKSKLKSLNGVQPCDFVENDYADECDFNICLAETSFVDRAVQRKTPYKNYHNELFKYAIKNYFDQIDDIVWPEKFMNEKRKGLISSMKVVNKFQL